MSEEFNFVRDLAVILISAGLFTIVSRALKQPLILGYIIAGFLIGPGIGFFPSISSAESVHQWSEIGIIFMMFGLGLEFSFKKLMKTGSAALLASVCKLLGMFVLGYLIGLSFGWTTMESMFLGGMLPMSSTMVVAKSYDEMGLKTKPYSGIVFGTLIIEDIMGIVLMVIFSTMAVSAKFSGTQLFEALGKLAFCLVLWFVVGIFLVPTLLKKAKRFLNDEILLIVSIGLCFGMVALAESMGFSSALGAFIMGSILAETIESEHIEKLVGPIKDLFGAIFFVSVGMMVSPQVLLQNWAVILLLVLVLLVFDVIFVGGGVLLAGRGLNNAVHAGMSLAQMGEFGFIIASVGVGLGVVSEFIYPVIISVFVVSNLIAPFVIRSSDGVYGLLKHKLPAPLLSKIDVDSAINATRSNAEKSEWIVLIKSYLVRIGAYGVIVIAVNSLSSNFLEPFVLKAFPDFSDTLRSLVVTIITLLLMSPFLYGMGVSSGTINSSVRKLLKEKSSNIWPVMAMVFVRTFIVVGIVISVIASHFELAGWTIVLILLGGAALVILCRRFLRKTTSLEKKFYDNFTIRDRVENEEKRVQMSIKKKLNGYDVHLEMLEVPVDSPFVGKKLKDVPIRAESGVNIVEIKRGSLNIVIPESDVQLFPYDKVLAVGSSSQIEKFKSLLSQKNTFTQEDGQFKVSRLIVEKDSYLYGKTLRNASLKVYKCMVISVLRGEDFTTNPKPDFRFEAGDIVWIAGEASSCDWIKGVDSAKENR